MALYLVRAWGGKTITVEAKDSTAAKRKACRIWGKVASAPLVGISGMTSKKING
jgi:hypothetical protein